MQDLINMIKSVCLVVVNNDDFVDTFEDIVYIAVIHDGSGYVPGASIAVSDQNEHSALEMAFETLEDYQNNLLTSEEQNERFETQEKEGYDTLTETYDGAVFEVNPKEFYDWVESLEDCHHKTQLEKLDFYYNDDFDMEKFVDSYLETAFWATCEYDENGDMGENLDENYDPDVDLDSESKEQIVNELTDFVEENKFFILKAMRRTANDETQLGHDLWLTRNGHGVGFWDGDWIDCQYKDYGQDLTKMAEDLGTQDLYAQDGKVFVM